MSENKKISIITMGCPKNMVDSEKLGANLLKNGFDVSHESYDADIIIINTCGFINDAKVESIDEILSFSKEKEEGKIEKLIVSGCLSERYKGDLQKEMPGVDRFFGVHDYDDLLAYVKDNPEISNDRLLSTPSHYAYLKIAEGCNRTCSFCAIPGIRGPLKSEPIEKLMEEAGKLAAKGVKELIVIAQDTVSYGIDLYGKSETARLLRELSTIDGIEWIRLMYTYPAGFPDELIDEIASNPKVLKYIDIPLQHIDDDLLKSMRRGGDKLGIIALIHKMREKIPGLCIRTAFIVGYPGETRRSFLDLFKFVKEMKFERMGVFSYSQEENTPAYHLGDPVAARTKMKRMSDLIQLHEKNSTERNQNLIGTECMAICDGKEDESFIGRLMCDAPEIDNIVFLQGKNLLPGNIYKVKIVEAGIFDLAAEIIRDDEKYL